VTAIERVAIVGGTGPHGCGLAQRLAVAGYDVVVGSRDPARADAVAARLREATGGARIAGVENRRAVADADAAILAIPAAGLAAMLDLLREPLANRIVVDVVVPLAFRDGLAEHAPPPGAGSAGELVQRALPSSRVVAAFKTIPASRLESGRPIEGDVLVCGDDPDARAAVGAMAARIPHLRAVDAGAMRNVRSVEGITALLVNLNRAHRAHTSVRVLGLD
jgi:8-hydroxy-5-deazaflavin:NADPH oxidoreductase